MITIDTDAWQKANKEQIDALTKTVAELRDEIRQLGSVVLAQEQRNNELQAALQRIAKWEGEFPSTGEHWPDGSPISYVAQYGSNGERDYMRAIAATALATSIGSTGEITHRRKIRR